jgi:hypothetical protein
MTSPVYQINGPTKLIVAGVTPGTANVTGVNTIKVDNVNNSSVDVFFNYGLANTTTATVANATTAGQGVCIQHNATEYIQLMNPNASAPQTVYLAVAAASNVNVYVTPVAIVSQG